MHIPNESNGWRVWMGSLAAAACLVGTPVAVHAEPIFEYRFNTTGTTTPSTGADATPLSIRSAGNDPVDLHGADGSGVSGAPGDRALDFSSAAGMGNNAGGVSVRAYQATDNNAADGLTSFTISGWYKTSAAGEDLDRYAHLFEKWAGNQGIRVFAGSGGAGVLTLGVDGAQAASATNGYTDVNKWVFFAVTYDGTQSADNIAFYRGYRNAAEAGSHGVLDLVSTATMDEGTPLDTGGVLHVGNAGNAQRPFQGYLDDIRLHGAKSGSAGALDLQSINLLRLQSVPEPATLGLIGAGLLSALCRRRWTASRGSER